MKWQHKVGLIDVTYEIPDELTEGLTSVFGIPIDEAMKDLCNHEIFLNNAKERGYVVFDIDDMVFMVEQLEAELKECTNTTIGLIFQTMKNTINWVKGESNG